MIRRAIVLLPFFVSAIAFGHDTWIAPDRFTAKRGATITLHMTSGMEYPKLDHAIKPDRVARAVVIANGRRTSLTPFSSGHSLDFRMRLRTTGGHVIAVDLSPKEIELKPEQVAEYLDEIGAGAALRDEWKNMPEPKRWREVYTKHAKTFVRIGNADEAWRDAAGSTLEIVPLADPTSLRAGDTLTLQLLEDGKPLANFSVGVAHESDPKGTLQTTDGAGQTAVRLEKSGRYLLRATHVRRANRGDADWVSDFTTMTFTVGPQRDR